MASRREPPRANQHAPSCPAYSVSAKFADCTCGLTTPKAKRNRPSITEAAEKAIAIEQAESEAERKAREQREAMEAAIMSPGTTQQKQVEKACPRCSECIGQKHHWIEATVYEESDPAYECKHCDAACGMRSDGAPNGKLMPRRSEDSSALDDDQEFEAAADAAFSEHVTAEIKISKLEQSISALLGRRISIYRTEADGLGSIAIQQRCPACGVDIAKLIANDTTDELRLTAEVGAAARHAYARHRCQPVEADRGITGMSRAEIEQLAQDLEHAGTEMINRSIAMLKLAKERADG